MNIDDLTKNELGSALNAELATKGLTATTEADADLVLVYQAAVRQEKQFTTFNSGYDYGPGCGPGWYGSGMGGGSLTEDGSAITRTSV